MPTPISSTRHLTSPRAIEGEQRLLLTLPQAASVLSISKRTLDRLIANRSFPTPLKIGRSSRVAHEDIAGYLENLRRQRGDKLGTS